jgi:hypothetical protein
MDKVESVLPVERVASSIYLIRGKKVMLDRDLAELYGMTTRNLYQLVKRKLRHFPHDFMFQLTYEETDALPFPIGRVKKTGRHRRYPLRVFTEQGVAMLSSILHNPQAAVRLTTKEMRCCDVATD